MFKCFYTNLHTAFFLKHHLNRVHIFKTYLKKWVSVRHSPSFNHLMYSNIQNSPPNAMMTTVWAGILTYRTHYQMQWWSHYGQVFQHTELTTKCNDDHFMDRYSNIQNSLPNAMMTTLWAGIPIYRTHYQMQWWPHYGQVLQHTEITTKCNDDHIMGRYSDRHNSSTKLNNDDISKRHCHRQNSPSNRETTTIWRGILTDRTHQPIKYTAIIMDKRSDSHKSPPNGIMNTWWTGILIDLSTQMNHDHTMGRWKG